jgi:hypothetical protein
MKGIIPAPITKTDLGIPIPTAADSGKVLQVNASGKYELVAIGNAEEGTY